MPQVIIVHEILEAVSDFSVITPVNHILHSKKMSLPFGWFLNLGSICQGEGGGQLVFCQILNR